MNAASLRFIFFWWICASGLLSAQSLRIVDSPKEISGSVGSRIESVIRLKNTGTREVQVQVERLNSDLLANQSVFFKLGDKITGVRQTISGNTIAIGPGQTVESFTAYLTAGFEVGESAVTYRFFDVRNPANYADFTINYRVGVQQDKDRLYVSNKINISALFPNPATHYAEAEYQIAPEQKSQFFLTINNVLGGQVAAYPLQSQDSRLRVSLEKFETGVYFYSLVIDDKAVVTRKFMVKK